MDAPPRERVRRIAIDMDEVIADALGEYLRRYNLEFDASLSREDVVGRKVYDAVPPERREATRAYAHQPGFFAALAPMRGSCEVVSALVERYEVFVATAAMEVPNSFAEKYDWMRRHLPAVDPMNLVFCGHKFVIAADLLIDDSPRHFERFPGEGWLFDAPHNALAEGHRRVRSWAEVAELLL